MRLFLLPSLPSFSRCFLTNYSRKSTGPITKAPFERIASQSIRRTNPPRTSSIKVTNIPPRHECESARKSASIKEEENNNHKRGISRMRSRESIFKQAGAKYWFDCSQRLNRQHSIPQCSISQHMANVGRRTSK